MILRFLILTGSTWAGVAVGVGVVIVAAPFDVEIDALDVLTPVAGGGEKSQLPSPNLLVCKYASTPLRLRVFNSTCLLSKGMNSISSSRRCTVSISDLSAQAALLKDTCSAVIPSDGKIRKLTGPVILSSRPVASFTVEPSN